MIGSWAVVLSALVYLCLLFEVAHWGDGPGRRFVRRRARGTIYALALAVYCTSWTFFGSVGFASRAGLDFLTIYLGPIIMIGLFHPLVSRIVRIAKAQNTTSIADFVAARYGKSERVAALVSIIALIGTLPYVALQLKAVSASLAVFLSQEGAPVTDGFPIIGDLALVVALVLAAFALAFGTRHADATEHQNGLVLAVAVESVVKLAAFLAVGIFVVYSAFGGLGGVIERVVRPDGLLASLGPTSDAASFVTMTLLSAFVALLLPRQFHMAVVENRSPEDVKTAAWLFPLYLVAINLFVIPIAIAGLDAFPQGSVDRDMTVLALPLKEGSGVIALIAFLGGLSAATAMVIVETVAVAIMVSNHLVMPLMLRRHRFSAESPSTARQQNLGSFLLAVRRIAIVVITLLAYAYYRAAGEAELAAIGLLSFAAIAQIAPAFFGGLIWRRGTALGATAALVVGILVWAYTLLLPSLAADTAWATLLANGPFGIAALRPTALAGLDLPQLTHGTLWSLGLNLAAYIGFSLVRPTSALERLQAAFFLREAGMPVAPSLRFFRASVSVDDLRAAVGRYLGEDRTRRSFAGFARAKGIVLEGQAEADIHLLRYAEHLLASAIGAASSRLALSMVLRRRNLSKRAALKLLDDASAAMQQNRDLLQHALDHAQQGISVLDRELHLLSWNQAFIDLYEFPPELVRIGVGLEEILRVNAERGLYGPGQAEDHVSQRLHSMLHDTGPVRLKLHPSGRVISVRSNHLPNGGLFTTYTDVTELVAEEEALERANETLEQRVRERTEELTRLNAALTEAKRQAEDANASKTRFLAAASHDILQPLNAARLYATSLVERTRGSGEMQLAENVDASLDAVEEILTTLLDISRLDSGAMRPRMTTFRLDDLLRQLAREFEPVAGEKGLSLRLVGTSLWVRTDRGLLRRLLQNLVSNAIKYTPEGRVVVGTRRRGDQLAVEVWDTGLGIPASKRRTVFREFQRLAEGARAARGLGLGLSIVERIAKALEVEVGLESQLGRGSVFRVALPVVAAEPVAPADPAPIRRPSAPLVHLSVLAIDNEPAILDGMRILLAGWGCDVVTATSLSEALVVLRHPPAGHAAPEVVIADYHLDDGNGLDAIAALREAAGTELPAVLVTADHSPGVREQAESRGISLLNKPLKPAALRALLTQWRATRIAAE
jgi:Na+/proline symporter/signal transduction histidine kinase